MQPSEQIERLNPARSALLCFKSYYLRAWLEQYQEKEMLKTISLRSVILCLRFTTDLPLSTSQIYY